MWSQEDSQGKSSDLPETMDSVDQDSSPLFIRDALELCTEPVLEELMDDPPRYTVLLPFSLDLEVRERPVK